MGQTYTKEDYCNFNVITSQEYPDNNSLREVKEMIRIDIPRSNKQRKKLLKEILMIGVTVVVRSSEYIVWVSQNKVDIIQEIIIK